MYVSRLFKWAPDHERGGEGWLMQRPSPYARGGYEPVEGFNPFEAGRVVAHDLVEHQTIPTRDDYLVNELIAVGHLAWIRLERGNFVKAYVHDTEDAGRALGRLTGDTMRDAWTNDGNRAYVPHCPHRPVNDEWIAGLRDTFTAELRRYIEGEGDSYTNDPEFVETELARVPDAVRWVEHGYRLCERRWFKGRTPQMGWTKMDLQYRANELFWEIAGEVDRLTKGEELYEGDTLRVGFTIKNFEVVAKTTTPGRY